MKNLLSSLFILLFTFSYGQSKGKIYGNIKDKSSALEPLPAVKVYVERSLATRTYTNDDGKYTLDLLPGKQIIIFKKRGYKTIKKEVKVESEKSIEVSVVMESLSAALSSVEKKGPKINKETVIKIQADAIKVSDTISLKYIKSVNEREITSEVNNIVGVLPNGEKDLVVRGNVNRNNASMLNGLSFKGLNTNTNTIVTDLIPSDFLQRISIHTLGTVTHSADFSGAIVDVETKHFRDKSLFKITAGIGYNPEMHFNSDYLNYSGSTTDFLGFDNGDRSIPVSRNITTQDLETATASFLPELKAKQANSLMNYNLGFTFGASTQESVNKFGYLTHLSYKSTTRFFENSVDDIYQKDASVLEPTDLESNRLSTGSYGEQNNRLTALADFYYDVGNSTYALDLMHIQDGTSQAGVFHQTVFGNNTTNITKQALTYTQSSISNALLSGTHFNTDKTWKIVWKLSPTLSIVKDKDHRITPLALTNTQEYVVDGSEYPIRIWRSTEDLILDNRVDFTNSHVIFENTSRLRFGAGVTLKNRNYSIEDYTFNTTATSIANGDADELLLSENIWTNASSQGTSVRIEAFDAFNAYDSSQKTFAGYVSEELNLFKKLSANIGVRLEHYQYNYTGQSDAGVVYDNENIMTITDIFPSATLSYNKNRFSSLSLSYAKTTQRPTTEELSTVQIYDPITTRSLLSNINLVPSYFNHLELSYKKYRANGSHLILNAFYKEIENPLEVVFSSDTSLRSDEIAYQNTDSEEVNLFGFGLDLRKEFKGFLTGLRFDLKGSAIFSSLKLSEKEKTARVLSAIGGETVEETRNIQGQAPYQISGGLFYQKEKYDVGFNYQVQGKTLEIVGSKGVTPDVYTQSFHALNFNTSKTFGLLNNHKISLEIYNLLNDVKESFYEPFGLDARPFSIRQPGRQFLLNYSFSF